MKRRLDKVDRKLRDLRVNAATQVERDRWRQWPSARLQREHEQAVATAAQLAAERAAREAYEKKIRDHVAAADALGHKWIAEGLQKRLEEYRKGNGGS